MGRIARVIQELHKDFNQYHSQVMFLQDYKPNNYKGKGIIKENYAIGYNSPSVTRYHDVIRYLSSYFDTRVYPTKMMHYGYRDTIVSNIEIYGFKPRVELFKYYLQAIVEAVEYDLEDFKKDRRRGKMSVSLVTQRGVYIDSIFKSILYLLQEKIKLPYQAYDQKEYIAEVKYLCENTFGMGGKKQLKAGYGRGSITPLSGTIKGD